jgi:hypothetical protein
MEPAVAAIARTRDEEFEVIVVVFEVGVVKVQGHPNGDENVVISWYFAKDGHRTDTTSIVPMVTELFRVYEIKVWVSKRV